MNASVGAIRRTVSSVTRQRWLAPELAGQEVTAAPSPVAWPPTSSRRREPTLTRV
ncbi:hypothetical protein HDA31_003335 [Micromonospora carbonacea subsp. aurantiaca]|nr:hypothetical protein [Micromonospora carbonacea]